MATFSKPQPPDLTTNAVLSYVNNKTYQQKVYVLGLQQIVAGDPFGEQNFTGWRYLTDIAPDLAAAGEVSQTTDDQTPSFSGLSYGPRLAKAVRASGTIETLDGVPAGNYELSLLRIPGLLIDAFWLRSSNTGNDLVVPYDTLTKGLQEMYVYRMDEFLNIVRPLAEKQLDDVALL